jgi:hypothetical protein
VRRALVTRSAHVMHTAGRTWSQLDRRALPGSQRIGLGIPKGKVISKVVR